MQLTNILACLALCILSLIILFFYLNARTKVSKIITSLLLGGVFAMFAYNFIPKANFDLTRHQAIASKFADVSDGDELMRVFKNNDLEFLPQVYSLTIGKIGNVNLLQTMIVLAGYTMLFYMLIDYRNKKDLKNGIFIPLMLLIIFGQHILYYFSGLYNYFAINLFAFAVYMDYVKGFKKTALSLYLLSPFIHVSMLLPLGLLLAFKINKNRLNKYLLTAAIIFFVLLNIFIGLLADATGIELLVNIRNTFQSYSAHNGKLMYLYDNFYLLMTITKILIVLWACWLQRYNEENKKVRHFALLLLVAIIILSVSSIAITRFSSLVLFVALPVIADAMSKKTDSARLLTSAVYVTALLYFVYSVYVMVPVIDFAGGMIR